MALCRQIVNFIRLNLTHQANQAGGIGQIAVMEPDGVFLNQVVDAGGVGNRSPSDNAVDLIALFQKELSEVAAVLAGDAGNQRFFHFLNLQKLKE